MICCVIYSEILYIISNYSNDVGVDIFWCFKVYVFCGDDEFINKNRIDLSDKYIGYLLWKDVYYLNDKVKVNKDFL